MTQYGGSIVQGSAGVRIGAPTGVACSVCPGGVTSGHPVNPLLGAKVLPGETDIALPGPLPFILSRTYSSYRTKTPAPVGSLGPGWKMPAELARTQRRSLADALQQSGGEDGGSVVFPPVLVQMLDRLESEILADRVSEESRRWLASCGLTVEQMQNQMDPVYTPARKIHLYHCDHRGLPLALISTEGATAWCAEYDEWGNLLSDENPHHLQQLIRLPGQQYDEESGLYYNRHRYYDPLQGRYITQDPIGLKGGWNFYQYPLNPVINVDPQGLVDINLYPESDLIHSVADEINIPGVFTIGGHGTPTSIESATRSIMTAKDLAYLIKFDGNYKDGMTVWLFSCNTGKGQNSFASQLAKELHTNVIGPDTLWTWWGRGTNGKLKMDTVLTAPTNLNSNKDLMAITTKDLGNWITYGPSGHPISNMQGTPEKPSDIR
ncbi:RHS repeat-associated core domain-containing protein [Escherichia coli]|uniref:RHS repeat-associated core domain-containing protein n=1 Tax=Escherichia coli TaxID=562 RepID=UPI003F844541